MRPYFIRLLLSIDQFINVLLSPLLNLFVQKGGALFGDVDETLSSVMRKNVKTGTCKLCVFMCLVTHIFDRDHCKPDGELDEGSVKK